MIPQGDELEVVAPHGRRGGLPEAVLAPRLTELEGRTIAFVWDHIFRGEEMFEVFVQEASRSRDVRAVGYTEFGNIHGTADEEKRAIEELPEQLRAHRVDAVVVGVGA